MIIAYKHHIKKKKDLHNKQRHGNNLYNALTRVWLFMIIVNLFKNLITIQMSKHFSIYDIDYYILYNVVE